jgi:hypothetical protein
MFRLLGAKASNEMRLLRNTGQKSKSIAQPLLQTIAFSAEFPRGRGDVMVLHGSAADHIL